MMPHGATGATGWREVSIVTSQLQVPYVYFYGLFGLSQSPTKYIFRQIRDLGRSDDLF